jgi:hypothetical protein
LVYICIGRLCPRSFFIQNFPKMRCEHRDANNFAVYFLARTLLNLAYNLIVLPKKFNVREISDVSVTKYYEQYVL